LLDDVANVVVDIVAIDRTKFAFVEMHEKVARRTVRTSCAA
jgi:hypothetical protein